MGTSRKTTKGESSAPRRARRTSAPSAVGVMEKDGDKDGVVTSAAPATPSPAASMTDGAPVGHDAIALRAYELFVASGYQHGNELQHWLTAEAELRAARGRARS